MISKNDIANKLLSIRLGHAMTQKDFGLECGLSSSVISQYEQGLRNPSKKALYQICNRYNIDPKDFNLPDKSPYLSKNKTSSNIDKNILNSLLEEIRKKDERIKELEIEKYRLTNLQKIGLESVGSKIWIHQTKLRRKGLKWERKITDIGNSYEIFVDFLGYSKKESELLLSTDWIPVFSKDPNHPMNKCLSVNSLKSIKSLFFKLPSIIQKIGKSGKAEIPFYTTWIKQDGTLVNSSVNFDINISTMVTTINAHFED